MISTARLLPSTIYAIWPWHANHRAWPQKHIPALFCRLHPEQISSIQVRPPVLTYKIVKFFNVTNRITAVTNLTAVIFLCYFFCFGLESTATSSHRTQIQNSQQKAKIASVFRRKGTQPHTNLYYQILNTRHHTQSIGICCPSKGRFQKSLQG